MQRGQGVRAEQHASTGDERDELHGDDQHPGIARDLRRRNREEWINAKEAPQALARSSSYISRNSATASIGASNGSPRSSR